MTTRNSNYGDVQTSPLHDKNYDIHSQKPEDDRKLFVGGLTWDTTQEDLREYFSNFGNILDCSIKHDPTTGRSRGFAFLIFDRKDIVERILSQSEHFVKGRKVDPKPAHRRLAQTNPNHTHSALSSSSSHSLSNNNRKVFIGGLDPNFPDVQLREYFSQFGTIDEIDLPYDKEKNERRPFCFISFQNEQSAQEVLRLQKHTIGDVTVDVKRAKPKTSNNQQQQAMYDPYGQQSVYSSYGSGGVPSYGSSAYSAADPYANWNNYSYNQQANPTGFSYNGSGTSSVPNSGSSSYSQYPQHQLNSQYSYAPANANSANEYYSQYGYSGQQQATPSVYADPNVYGAGYEYNNYYGSMGAGMNGSVADNGSGQQGNSSPNDASNYDHDNHYGKAKAAVVTSPHSYPIS